MTGAQVFSLLDGGGWKSPGRPNLGAPVVVDPIDPPPVDPTPPTTGTPSIALPTIAEVEYSTLNPGAGEHMGTVLARLSSQKRVHMPAGHYPIIGNAMTSGYSVYAPNALGIRGDGIDKTFLELTPNSFKTLAVRPKQAGGGLMRLGPNGGAVQPVRTMSGLTILGTPQAGADGLPMFAGGYQNYYGRGETWQNVKIRGIAYGGGNSPNTGETFAINMFHDVDSLFEFVEVDGRDAAGNMIAGSPLGGNGSINMTLRDCYFHHSLYSGLTFSIAGSLSSPTTKVTTLRVKVEQNANHPNVGSGSRFSGVNHEHVAGAVRHTLLDVTLDQPGLWDSNHVSWGTSNADNPDMVIDSPIWHGLSPNWANKAFVVSMWGNQVTPPVVKNTDGSLKQPVIVKGQNPPFQNINPQTQYACIVGTGYVAP